VIPWDADPATFVASALSPAQVQRVDIDEPEKTAVVIVPERQLSLAIGREGQNARLAARLTGWRIDIKSDVAVARAELEAWSAGGVLGEALSGDAAAATTDANAEGPAAATDIVVESASAEVTTAAAAEVASVEATTDPAALEEQAAPSSELGSEAAENAAEVGAAGAGSAPEAPEGSSDEEIAAQETLLERP